MPMTHLAGSCLNDDRVSEHVPNSKLTFYMHYNWVTWLISWLKKFYSKGRPPSSGCKCSQLTDSCLWCPLPTTILAEFSLWDSSWYGNSAGMAIPAFKKCFIKQSLIRIKECKWNCGDHRSCNRFVSLSVSPGSDPHQFLLALILGL